MKRVEQMTTTPVENVMPADFWEEYLAVRRDLGVKMRAAGRGLTAYHQQALGVHHYTFTSEFRFRVWEFGTWRLFVSDKKGVCMEVLQGATEPEARAAWNEYKAKMGVPS